jgi:ribosome modulation factor
MKDESKTGEFVLEVFETYGEAYYRGRVAADLGHSRDSCPYNFVDPQSAVWLAGWLRQNEIWVQIKTALKPL